MLPPSPDTFSTIANLLQSQAVETSRVDALRKHAHVEALRLLERTALQPNVKVGLAKTLATAAENTDVAQALHGLHAAIGTFDKQSASTFQQTMASLQANNLGGLGRYDRLQPIQIQSLPRPGSYLNIKTVRNPTLPVSLGQGVAGGLEQVTYSGFDVAFAGAYQQTSSTYRFNYSVAGSQTPTRSLMFYQPSASTGFIALGDHARTPFKAPGEAIYSVAKKFAIDIENGKPVIIDGFENFQKELFGRATSLIDNYTGANKEKYAGEVLDLYQQTVNRALRYVGSAGSLQDVPINMLNANSQLAASQSMIGFYPEFAKNPAMFQPGSDIPYRAVEAEKGAFAVSSSQAGSLTRHHSGTLMNAPTYIPGIDAYQPGHHFDWFREVHKSIGGVTPIEGAVSSVAEFDPLKNRGYARLLPGAFSDTTGFSPVGKVFNIQFANVGMFNTDPSSPLAGLNLNNATLFDPDGAVIANRQRMGAIPMSYSQSATIKVTGPGAQTPGYVDKSLFSLLHGGEVTVAGHSVTIKGLSAAQGDYQAALEIIGDNVDPFLQARLRTEGLELPKGAVLGLDMMGETVNTIGRENVQQNVRFANMTEEGLHLTLDTTTVHRPGQDAFIKIAGGPQTHAKLGMNFASPEAIAALGVQNVDATDLVFRSNVMDKGNMLQAPDIRAYYQSGGMQRNLQEAIERGGADVFKSEAHKKAAGILGQHMDPMEVLKLLGKGNLQEYEAAFGGMSAVQGMAEYLGANKDVMEALAEAAQAGGAEGSVEQRLARAAGALYGRSDAGKEALKETLENIYSPYNDAMFAATFGAEPSDVTRYHAWGDPANKARSVVTGQEIENYGAQVGKVKQSQQAVQQGQAVEQMTRQQRGQKTKEVLLAEANALADELLGSGHGTNILASQQTLRSRLVAGIRDEGNILGMGQRASLEPRAFYGALATQHMPGEIMHDITRRMTDFSPAVAALQKTIKGHTGDSGQTITPREFLKAKAIPESKTLTLGIDSEILAQVNHQLTGKSSFEAHNALYLPSEGEFASMGMMQQGLSLERHKGGRQVYVDFAKRIEELKAQGAGAQEYTAAFETFYSDLQTQQKLQMVGRSGGEQHGMLRNRVAGSRVLAVEGHSLDLWQEMAQGKHEALAKNVRSAVDEFGIGRVAFVNESAAESMIQETLGHYRQQFESGAISQEFFDQMTSESEIKLQRLREGQGVSMIVGRDPNIGQGSLTPIQVFIDPTTKGQTGKDILRIAIEEAELTVSGKSKKIQVSSLLDLAGDHDGDRFKMFFLASQASGERAEEFMKNTQASYKHAGRYGMIKEHVIDTIGEKVKAMDGTAGTDLWNFNAQQMRNVRAAQAQGNVKVIVPQISNVFTKLKTVAALDDKIGSDMKELIWGVMEAAEQVPISGKRFVDATQYGDALVQKATNLSEVMYGSDDAARNAAIDDLMDLLIGNKDKLEGKLKVGGQEVELLADFDNMRTAIKQSVRSFAADDKNQVMIKAFTGKGGVANISPQELADAMVHMSRGLQPVHAHMENLQGAMSAVGASTNTTGRQASRNATTGVVGDIIERAANKPHQPLNYKSLAAIGAAGMLAMGVGSLLAAPTFQPIKNKENYVDPEYMFPDEIDSQNPNLHRTGIGTPSGVMTSGGFQGTIQLPPGGHMPQTVAGRVAAMGHGATMNFIDHRMSIDAHRIDRIQRDVI